MEDLTKLQKELKQIVLTFEEKASSRIDNKHQLKQFTSLVKNEDINDELINFIIDVVDEVNTRHSHFVDNTVKTIKEMSDITHQDIEKLKESLEKSLNENKETVKVEQNKGLFKSLKFEVSDIKFFTIMFLILFAMLIIFMNSNNTEFYKFIHNLIYTYNSTNGAKG